MLWRLLFIALIELIQLTVWRSSSSKVNNSHPDRAIDGRTDTCVTITSHRPENSPWWKVQLQGIQQISSVSIFSKDLTGAIMTGAAVQILVESYNNRLDRKICANITDFRLERWNDFTCTKQVSGRYVNVSFPGTRLLVLCEVKIYGKKKDPINTANSITSQSSNNRADFTFNSVKATDGVETVCARTKDEQGDHWWRIDLLGVFNISGVSIYNQIGNKINGAQIHVGNSRENNGINNKKCANITHFEDGEWNDFRCTKKVSGRYVTVFFPGTRHLILCEVKIYGKKKVVESRFKLIEENKTWEHALEHCRERNMDLATILNEDDQTLAELEARRAQTPYLWLGLHYTCILEVWFWVADYRLEFNRWAYGQKTGDCDRSAVMSRAEDHQWFSKSDYDEFNFICQKF